MSSESDYSQQGQTPTGFCVNLADPRATTHSPAQLLVVQEVEQALTQYFDQGQASLRSAVHCDAQRPLQGYRAGDQQRFEVVGWRYKGIHTGKLLGLPPTGRPASALGVSLVLLPDGVGCTSDLTAELVAQTRVLRSIDWLPVLAALKIPVSSRGFG